MGYKGQDEIREGIEEFLEEKDYERSVRETDEKTYQQVEDWKILEMQLKKDFILNYLIETPEECGSYLTNNCKLLTDNMCYYLGKSIKNKTNFLGYVFAFEMKDVFKIKEEDSPLEIIVEKNPDQVRLIKNPELKGLLKC